MNLKAEVDKDSAAAVKGRAAPRACLLCGGAPLEVVDALPCEDIRKAWRVCGVSFSAASWSAFEGMGAVELFRCTVCGFQFCRPELAGDGIFYAELERQRSTYYAPDVPEFTRTLGWAASRGWQTVLDVGCGE